MRRLDDGVVYEEAYDKLILSPGAKPVRPALPGINDSRIFTLRNVEDTFAIHAFIEQNAPRRAVVAGGGFIGLEMAENLTQQGIETTIVERMEQVMAPLDSDMACSFMPTCARRASIFAWVRQSLVLPRTKQDCASGWKAAIPYPPIL